MVKDGRVFKAGNILHVQRHESGGNIKIWGNV